MKKEDDSFGAIKCSICLVGSTVWEDDGLFQRSTEYGIVSSSFDSPRCQDCFDQIKNSTLITQTPVSRAEGAGGSVDLTETGGPLEWRLR